MAHRYIQALKEDPALGVEEALCWHSLSKVKAGELAPAAIQTCVDSHWAHLVARIAAAASKSVGYLKYDTHTASGFWTEELEEERDSVQALQAEAQGALLDGTLSRTQVKKLFQNLTRANSAYRVNLKKRHNTMFTNAVDHLGHPSNIASFMRMVKGARARQTGKGCALDPNRADQHVDHYKGTFGGAPTGQPLPPDMIRVGMLPEADCDDLVKAGSVLTTVGKLARGKAWGADNIPAEFLQEGVKLTSDGPGPLVKPLVAFLSLVFTSAMIPTVWRMALVVPVWKKKGSDKDIANYRPISLTCIGRRLYERLLLLDIKRFEHQLADSQGGFRKHRGMEQQALSLHEALVANPRARTALLDLKAAYDMVDRGRLWQSLEVEYGFPPKSIQRLQDLFDSNVSCLQVGGQQSKELPNLRGLLQGSSLSPCLFNFHINGLAKRLTSSPCGVMVFGRRINNLLFADDTALIAATDLQLATLLDICEQWSIEVGMKFSPEKCLCFAPTPRHRTVPLQLYGCDLPSVESATYLGFPFTSLGINFAELCNSRCTKAKGAIAALRGIGMNVTGWAPASSALIYTTFIRPILEYGVGLKMPTPALLSIYQRTQNLALRCIFSAPPNTSTAAMHRLLGVPSFHQRAIELNFLSSARFHNSTDGSIVGVTLWHRGVEPARSEPHPSSLPFHSLNNNPLLVELRDQLLDHTTIPPLGQPGPPQPPHPLPLSRGDRRDRQVQSLQAWEQNSETVGAAVKVRDNRHPHHLLTVKTKATREDRVSLTRWQLGLVAAHQRCKKCSQEVSRLHAIACAGVQGELDGLVAHVPPGERFGVTDMDVVLNSGAEKGLQPEVIAQLVGIISTIERVCRGRERTAQGFWKAPAGASTST